MSEKHINVSKIIKEEKPVIPPTINKNSFESFDNTTLQSNNTNNCNIINSNIIKDYKNKYYQMYKHQIDCNKKNNLVNTNNIDCNQSTDANSINRYTLVMNNKKSCANCINEKKDYRKSMYSQLPDEVKNIDNEIYNKKKITSNNVSNFVNFENNVYQNSIGETSVDKMAEIRTNIGTCGLKDYGTTIADIYDNLLSTASGKKVDKIVHI